MELSKIIHENLHYKMLLTREFELTVANLFAQGKVHGTAHFCIGEEATGVGVSSALEKEDYITQTHRGHSQGIGKNMDVKRMMAEFLGKESGYCKGRGGSMHIADFSVGSLGANGVVGGGIPIAAGSALTQKYTNSENVTVSFFGDGATNEGSFHESMNLASVWKLPLIFVCTNNLYGMSMHVNKSMNISDISIRASSYGMKGKSIDGNDVIAVYKETLKAKEYVKENGPIFLVLNTYRWMGHSKSDKQLYRSKKEVEKWKESCPIKRHHQYLLDNNIFSDKELKNLKKKAEQEVIEALEFAENSPEPTIDTIFDDVYSN